MPDKPTWRVVALIVLLIVVAAALRGYLPARDRTTHAEPGSSRAALLFVVVALSATLTLLAVAVIARLRDPRAAAPKTSDLSDKLGTGRGRPSWRVLLIGLGVIIAWLLIAMLLARLWAPQVRRRLRPPRLPARPRLRTSAAPPPQQRRPRNNTGDMYAILLTSAIPTMLLLVAGTVISSRRQRQGAKSGAVVVDDDPNPGRRCGVPNRWCAQPNSGWPR